MKIELSGIIKQRIREIVSEAPFEKCGVVTSSEILELPNTATDKENEFLISESDWEQWQEHAVAVWHSHWRSDQPGHLTEADIKMSRSLKIPYLIYHSEFGTYDYFDPDFPHPFPLGAEGEPEQLDYYLNKPFIWRRHDCYALVRNYYKGMLKIDLPDFIRPEYTRFAYTHRIEELFGNAGFLEVPGDQPVKTHDIIAIAINNDTPHHLNICTDREKGTFLHVFDKGHLSELFPWSDWHSNQKPLLRLRHKSLFD